MGLRQRIISTFVATKQLYFWALLVSPSLFDTIIMEFKTTDFEGLIEIYPKIWHDSRGYFFESYKQDVFANHGIPFDFVQDNHSFSNRGVLRGLHFQRVPKEQGKLVRAITGKVMDVVVDLRPQSATFGHHAKFVLDGAVGNMLYVPTGFAHGFLALADTIFTYKCTELYEPTADGGVLWNDPTLAIDWEFERWGIQNPVISDKDQKLPSFKALFEPQP
jgi:dTDP-4-dehydrorhamnose 3,5-epimerase